VFLNSVFIFKNHDAIVPFGRLVLMTMARCSFYTIAEFHRKQFCCNNWHWLHVFIQLRCQMILTIYLPTHHQTAMRSQLSRLFLRVLNSHSFLYTSCNLTNSGSMYGCQTNSVLAVLCCQYGTGEPLLIRLALLVWEPSVLVTASVCHLSVCLSRVRSRKLHETCEISSPL